MSNLESIKNRVRQILDDAESKRFNDGLLENAIRLALQVIDEKLPQVLASSQEVSLSGRDQTLSGLTHCLYLIRLTAASPDAAGRETEIGSEYTYTLQSGVASLHFSGTFIPQAGQTLQVSYAAQNSLDGLDGAESTTLSEVMATALEFGGAGYACLLRAAAISEAYGARPGECARLVELSHLWIGQFNQMLSGLKNLQEFGYPAGFALDEWDRKGG